MSCGCGKPKCDGKCGIGPSVLKIENNNCTLFHRVDVPASMGDETVNPPKNGAYKNVLLYYEASGNSYLYSSDGIPTKLTGAISDYEMLTNKPSINGVVLIKDKTLEDLGIIKAIDDAVGPEREERIAADEAEKAAREEADNEERDMRIQGDMALDQRISDEVSARAEADANLDAKITEEIADRTAGDTALDGKISDEAQARADADTALENKKADRSEIPTTVAELTDSANYVKFTDYATDTTSGVIKTSATRGTYLSADNQISAQTKTYAQYQSAQPATFIGKGTLENVLAGKELQNATQVAEAVAAEAALREAGDTALDTRLTAETTARENADTALNNAITSETNAREIADEDLQEQIDAIAASSDVIDIVGTKAALDAYDKSKVHDNDIIKVLNDETRDHATTYYRFNVSTQTWSYVGAEGPFYTKAEADGTFVPLTRTVNGKALSNNITLNAGDVGAATTSALAAEAATRLADDEALQSQIDEATGAIEELDASKADKSELKDPADYYWANVKVSGSSKTDTAPTFKQIKTTGGSFPHIRGNDTHLTLSPGAWEQGKGGVVIEDATFRPSNYKNKGMSLGQSGALWSNLYMNGSIYKDTYQQQLQDKAGTIALTSDIPTKKVNYDRYQNATANIVYRKFTVKVGSGTGIYLASRRQNYIIQSMYATVYNGALIELGTNLNSSAITTGTRTISVKVYNPEGDTKTSIYIKMSPYTYVDIQSSEEIAQEDLTEAQYNAITSNAAYYALTQPNNATLTIQKNGTNVNTFTANASSNVTANITVPTKTSDLSNDSGFLTSVPTASADTLGGIKVGENLSIDANGVLSAQAGLDNAYWANIKVSDSSKTDTSPTFKQATFTGASTAGYPHVSGNGGSLALSANNTWAANNGNVILNTDSFRPSTNSSGAINLGKSDSLWKNLYMNGNIYKGSYTLTLPNKTGTVALTSDIPSIDTALSDTSTNPVQNKAVKSALDGKNKIIYTAYNITPTADTTAAWKTALGGDGIYVTWYNQAGKFAKQPSTYGFLITIIGINDIKQDFYTQTGGGHYMRTGNGTGWYGASGNAGDFRFLGNSLDETLSTTSNNPVRNSVVTAKINEIDRFYSSLRGDGTTIAANSDLNTIDFLKINRYHSGGNSTVATYSNCPTTVAFKMEVMCPYSKDYDDETTSTWVERIRKITDLHGDIFIQKCNSNGEKVWTYGSWTRFAKTSDIGNATLTIQKNGTNVDTFTANATSNKTVNITVPTKTSDLTNDSSFATVAQATYTAGDHISIENNVVTAEDYVHSENPLASISPTNTLAGSNITNSSIAFDKTVPGDFLKLQLTTVDPGEGSPLAANTILGVYQ